jgi:DNA-directed RNA polymerase subunit RPC12/RpoP
MPSTGEKPGTGIYICDYCGTEVILDKAKDDLPPCPKCKRTSFHRSK